MHYRNFIIMIRFSGVCGLLCGMLALPSLGEVTADAPKRPNVLFIAIDDLRPQLGCYGHDEIHSPQIDKLAAQGCVFERAYANSPVCGASRLSVLTGIRAHPNQRKTDDMGGKFTSLPAHFKNHGYHTVSIGKVFHHMHDREADWSVPPWRSAAIYHGEKDWAGYNHYGIWQNPQSANHISAKERGPYRESAEVEDDAYQDGKVADQTIAELNRLQQQDKTFFLATGFWRRHLPFNAPKKYWDMYQRDNIAMAPNRNKPENLPPVGMSSGEFDGYAPTGKRDTDEFHREARRAYYACISYVDAQVGKIIEERHVLEIAREWIQRTIPADAPTRATILRMMLGSHEALVDYPMPLGLNMLCAYDGHYDPSPATRTYFHKADAKGLGFIRTKQGSNYAGQYHPELQAIFDVRDKKPLELLLWFHHVPWDAKLSSGRTLLDELTFRYNQGVDTVDQMAETWESLEGKVPPAIHASVIAKLVEEKIFARQWSDECIRYFSGFASPGDDQ